MDYPTDADLVLASRSGNKEAFGRLVERHLPMANRVALSMTGDPEIARELAQESMLQAYLSIENLHEVDRFQNWLYGIVRNVCRSYQRSQRADFFSWEAVSGGIQAASTAPDPQEVVEKRELYRQMQKAIESPSAKNQEATRLFYFEQLSVREIAFVLGASVAAIKDRLYQSRKRLREQLTPDYVQVSNTLRLPESTIERKIDMIPITTVHALPIEDAGHYILYLPDTTSNRVLPIWVGMYEGHQIAQSLQGNAPARPMMIHLVANLLETLNAKLQEVRVEALKGNVFYAVVKAYAGDATQEFDARPSDAIALALNTGTPILVAEEVMQKTAQDLPRMGDEKAGVEEVHRQIEEGYRVASEWKQRILAGTGFTSHAQSVVTQMQAEALRLKHNYIGTEHVLLSLARDGEGTAGQVLHTIGVELEQLIEAVERMVGHGEEAPSSEPKLVPRVAQVLAFAEEEKVRLEHASIGTGHLLLGLLREGQGMAIAILRGLDVDLDEVQSKTLELTVMN